MGNSSKYYSFMHFGFAGLSAVSCLMLTFIREFVALPYFCIDWCTLDYNEITCLIWCVVAYFLFCKNHISFAVLMYGDKCTQTCPIMVNAQMHKHLYFMKCTCIIFYAHAPDVICTCSRWSFIPKGRQRDRYNRQIPRINGNSCAWHTHVLARKTYYRI